MRGYLGAMTMGGGGVWIGQSSEGQLDRTLNIIPQSSIQILPGWVSKTREITLVL